MDMQFIGYKGLTGISYPDGSVTPNILRKELREIGYETLDSKILNAADFGVPQRRNRVIFIGYRKDMSKPSYPEPTHTPDKYVTISDAISDLIVDDKIRNEVCREKSSFQLESIKGRTPSIFGNTIEGPKVPYNIELSGVHDIIEERFSLFRQGESGSLLRKRVIENGIDLTDKPALIKLVSEKFDLSSIDVINIFKNCMMTNEQIDILLTKKNISQRFDENKPSSTVVTIADDYISPWESRTFNVREMARCQSFDDSFEFLGKRTTGG